MASKMGKIKDFIPGIPELAVLIVVGVIYWPLVIYVVVASFFNYRILKNYYFKKQKWGLNISCSETNGGGVNADIVPRNVPNFVLIKDIYSLPFRDKEFKDVFCSHTMEHVDDPDRFLKELKRISENVIILIPPLWDLAGVGAFREHKWQFLTLKTKHINKLPKKVKLPWIWYQKVFGQANRVN